MLRNYIQLIIMGVLFLCSLLFSCTQIDNYMLGKDNSPIPKELPQLKEKVKVQEKWSIITNDKKMDGGLKLQPAIVKGVVYAASDNGGVQAVSQATGRLVWSKKIDQKITSGPVVANGYIALGIEGPAVLLLKQNDGAMLWQNRVSGEVLAKPVITQSRLLVKTVDGNLYAFDLKNGRPLWLSDHGSPNLVLKASSSPALVGNKLALVGYSDGKMDAIDISTGQIIWQRSIAYANGASDVERLVDIDADPIVRGNVVYLASYQGYVGALSLVDGQFIWRKPASVYHNIALDAKTLYFTDSDDIIWALNRKNGQVNWKQMALKAHGLTEPVLLGEHLIIGDKMGLLHVLSIKNGDLLSRTKLSGPMTTGPTVANGDVYTMTSNGKLSRFSIG